MNDIPRNRPSLFAFMGLIAIALGWLAPAQAFQGILNDFNGTYGTAGTRLDQCVTCHVSNSNFNFNPYGSDMANSSLGAVEGIDSDGDGFSNIQEINALTFPGNANDFPQPVNQPPVADPNGPYNGTVGVPLQFDGSGSNDPDGNIVTYAWNFGDGNTGTGMNPSHTYNAAGSFTVSLTVTDDAGDSDSATTTATIGVGNQAPTADPNGPYSGTVGLALQFDGSGSSDPDGSIISYSWDFGDGMTGTGVSPSHAYTSTGVFNVTLSVMDDAGASDSAGTTATISAVPNLAPTADANGPYSGMVGTPVTFDGTGSSDPDGNIVRYDWNFGDGTTASDAGPTPSHSYGSDGSYSVTLTVFDDAGASATDTTTATIGAVANQPPTADANGPYNGTVSSPVSFDGSASSDPDGSIVSYAWDFGDGGSGSGVSPTHTYSSDGSFTVTLTVTDDAGASDTDTTSATIGQGNQPPAADANGPYSGTVGEPVQFDGTGSTDPEGGPLSYAWDFGDGSVGMGVSPTHSYATPGTYNVTLTVTDPAGASDADMSTATITVVTPPPGDDDDVDLRIEEFDVDGRHYLGSREGIEIELEVINTGSADAPRMATVVGMQNGAEVYRHAMMVSAPAGGWRDREFEFPAFRPSQTGDIRWTATIAAAMDRATETTSVLAGRVFRDDDDDDDDDDRRRFDFSDDGDGDSDRDRRRFSFSFAGDDGDDD